MVRLAVNSPDTHQSAGPSSSSSSTSFSPNSDNGFPPLNHGHQSHGPQTQQQPQPQQQQSTPQSTQQQQQTPHHHHHQPPHHHQNNNHHPSHNQNPIPPHIAASLQHQPPHHHMHHENGHGLYIPYAGEFYPTEHGYFIPPEICPTHAPLCLHSDFGKSQIL